MSWVPTTPAFAAPNLTEFYSFLQNVVGIPSQALPPLSNNVIDSGGNQVIDSSGANVTSNPPTSWVNVMLTIAMEIVNDTLQCASQDIYTLAVYNLAADRVINFGQDSPPSNFFAKARSLLKIDAISVGIVASAGDQGSNTTMLNPDFMRNLTFMDLQMMKTPYGRAYMGFAQMYGSNLWGVT